MRTGHIELLVEEESMEAFLRTLLPRVLPAGLTFDVHAFQGKADLQGRLESRLRGYREWMPRHWRIVVVVDRDDDNCKALKKRMEEAASSAGLPTRSRPKTRGWRVANRIAIEELEAWYFGDWQAVRDAYPRVSATVPKQAPYRDPDAIAGGTWESFERVLKRGGYFTAGLRKAEAARAVAARFMPERCTSHSFGKMWKAIGEAA